jgi:hypothetical protein
LVRFAGERDVGSAGLALTATDRMEVEAMAGTNPNLWAKRDLGAEHRMLKAERDGMVDRKATSQLYALMEKARASARNTSKARQQGVVYFIEAPDLGSVKIGWCGRLSGVDVRIGQLQVGSVYPLVLRGIIEECSVSDEQMFHRFFGDYRQRGEWFRVEGSFGDWMKLFSEQPLEATELLRVWLRSGMKKIA